MVFQKATKEKAKLRMALTGPSGSGKTYSALNIAQYLGKKIALIDTEGNSASKYANLFGFDVLSLTDCHPSNFVKAIDAAVAEGYDLVIIDSLSHAWSGKNGLLELADREKMKISNQFQAWAKVAPFQNALTNKLLVAPIHIITTLRVKTAYEMQEENGKKKPVKIGLAPVQKEGIEYEFDVLAEMNPDNTFIVSKTRCPELNGFMVNKPGKEVADVLNAWLSDGVEPTKPSIALEEEMKADAKEEPQNCAQTAEQPKAVQSASTAVKKPAATAASAAQVPAVKPVLKLQTAPKKETVPAEEKPAVGVSAQACDFPERGVFERVGVLADIKREEGASGGNKWQLFFKDIKTGLITFSQAVNVQAVSLIGKQVKIKAIANNPGQYIILSINPAN